MADKEAAIAETRVESVEMMRWSDDDAGVLSFTAEVAWVREVRARTVLRMDGEPERALTSFPAGPGLLDAIAKATASAAIAARAYSPFSNFELTVVAELWQVPRLARAAGNFVPVPEDWFLDEGTARNAWLLAASMGTRTEDRGERPADEMIEAATVWSSRQKMPANQASLEAFTQGVENVGQVLEGPGMGL